MKHPNFYLIPIGALLAVIIFLLFKYCNKPTINTALLPHDTIWVDHIKLDTVYKENQIVKPIYITRYRDKDVYRIDTTTIIKSDTETVLMFQLDSTKTIEPLLQGEFAEGYLKLSLVDSNGQVYTKNYLLDYSKYRYLYDGTNRNLITLKDTSDFSSDFTFDVPPKTNKMKGLESYAYLLYDPFKGGISIRTDLSLNIKKLGLYTFGELNTLKPNARIGVGIRYRITP